MYVAALQVQPFNINVTDGEKTCNRGEEWGVYKGVVNCNTCRMPGLRITKESIWGFFEGRTLEDRLGLPLERSRVVGYPLRLPRTYFKHAEALPYGM